MSSCNLDDCRLTSCVAGCPEVDTCTKAVVASMENTALICKITLRPSGSVSGCQNHSQVRVSHSEHTSFKLLVLLMLLPVVLQAP